MDTLFKLFNRVTVKQKLIASYLLVVLVPFVIFTVFSLGSFVSQAQESSEEHTAQLIRQITNSVDTYIESLDKVVDGVSLFIQDTDFFMIDSEDDPEWNEIYDDVYRQLKILSDAHPEIAGILVANKYDLYTTVGMTRTSRDLFKNESWCKKALKNTSKMHLIGKASGRNVATDKNYSVDDVFSISKAVVSPETGEYLGVVLFDIKHDIIRKSINDVTIGQKGFVYIMDEEDNVVYSPVNDVVYRINSSCLSQEGTPINASLRGGTYQLRYQESDYTGWKTVGVFSIDEIMGSVNYLLLIFLVTMAAALVIVTILSLYFTRSITRPIMKLRVLMKRAEEGDLSIRFNNKSRDEIGQLGNSFNHMINRIQDLIQMVYMEQKRKRDAELKSLQEQIKPHFLYNTLDAISWMARDYNAMDIVKLIDALTNMFRVGLSSGREIISVKEELTHVSNYLYIQKIRYKDKLNYEIHIDETLYNFRIPKLILQPLVENAIYHGIKAKRGGGNIYVNAEILENKLMFYVRDDGAGMSQEKLEDLNSQLSREIDSDEKLSFGLFYIKERIRLCYGSEYGVCLSSELGKGTTATVTLPVRDV